MCARRWVPFQLPVDKVIVADLHVAKWNVRTHLVCAHLRGVCCIIGGRHFDGSGPDTSGGNEARYDTRFDCWSRGFFLYPSDVAWPQVSAHACIHTYIHMDIIYMGFHFACLIIVVIIIRFPNYCKLCPFLSSSLLSGLSVSARVLFYYLTVLICICILCMAHYLTHALPLSFPLSFSLSLSLPLSLSLSIFLSLPLSLRYFVVTLQRITPPTLDHSNYDCALKIAHSAQLQHGYAATHARI